VVDLLRVIISLPKSLRESSTKRLHEDAKEACSAEKCGEAALEGVATYPAADRRLLFAPEVSASRTPSAPGAAAAALGAAASAAPATSATCHRRGTLEMPNV
jgi:hypothetical protein